jgi:hypothetical protein
MAEKIYQHTPDGRVELTEEEATEYTTWRDKENKILADTKWIRDRQAEYPSIQECVHAILDDDLTALQEKRQAIKTKYPKG